jgi:dTDP-4-dehydrorhamnose reductase
MTGKRILITGAGGRLGGQLVRLLSQTGHTALPFDHSALDISDWAAVRQALTTAHPDLVINTAAYTDVDGAARDPDLAFRVNGLGAGNLAAAAYEARAMIVQISTNEIFDGQADRLYRENDRPNPINPYGASKWAGEQAVMRANPNHQIVRTSWLFAHGGRNFIQSILGAAQAGRPLRVVTDEVANPTYTDDLAEAILELAATGRPGAYHLVNAGAVSRYEFARFVLDKAGFKDTPIEPIASAEWQRASTPPRSAGLLNSAAAAMGVTMRGWHMAVEAFLEREGLMQE